MKFIAIAKSSLNEIVLLNQRARLVHSKNSRVSFTQPNSLILTTATHVYTLCMWFCPMFTQYIFDKPMISSSYGNTSFVTGPLLAWLGESIGHRWIPLTKANDAELWCFYLRLNKRLSNQSRRRWFETPSRPLWRHCNAKIVYIILQHVLGGICILCLVCGIILPQISKGDTAFSFPNILVSSDIALQATINTTYMYTRSRTYFREKCSLKLWYHIC